MKERIRQIREYFELDRTQIAEQTGISKFTWANIELGKQQPNGDHIEAIAKKWPQFAYWLVTGETDEEHGHTSPILERIRADLKRAGKAA